MGSAASISDPLLPFAWPDEDKLPKDVIHLSPDSPPELLEKVEIMIAKSFSGNTKHTGEIGVAWAMNDGEDAQKFGDPMPKEPSESRIQNFRYLTKMCAAGAIAHGGCYALTHKEDPQKIAAAIMIL